MCEGVLFGNINEIFALRDGSTLVCREFAVVGRLSCGWEREGGFADKWGTFDATVSTKENFQIIVLAYKRGWQRGFENMGVRINIIISVQV